MRRIERLINLVAALLESPRPMTADDIRAHIAGYDQATHEAFRRAFERDKQALREMGVPLEVVRTDPFAEQADAYTIPKERYYLPDLDLEPDELAALGIAAQTLVGRGERDAGLGMLKLSVGTAAAPPAGPGVVAGADVAVEEPLGDVYAALLDKAPLEFEYEDARGRRTWRRVEVWGVVHRAGHWYAIGRDTDADAQRTFKLARIRSRPKRLGGGYEVPESFDPARALGTEPWESGPDAVGTVVVRFDASVRWWAEQNLLEPTARPGPEGSLDVELPTGNVAALLGWVVGWHGAVTIQEPAELRRRLVEHLRPWRPAA